MNAPVQLDILAAIPGPTTSKPDADSPVAPEKPTPRSRPLSFWRDSEDVVVVEEQSRTAVYTNTRGAIAIRQESRDGDNEDPVIVLRRENVEALVAALKAERDG